MPVSQWCTIIFAFAARELDTAPFISKSLLELHRCCWKHIREACAGSEPSAKGTLLREVGNLQSHLVASPRGGTGACCRACLGNAS